jgi:hypothetical protein
LLSLFLSLIGGSFILLTQGVPVPEHGTGRGTTQGVDDAVVLFTP